MTARISLALLLAFAAASLALADGGEDPGAYKLMLSDNRAELERSKWLIVSFNVDGEGDCGVSSVAAAEHRGVLSGWLHASSEREGNGWPFKLDPKASPTETDVGREDPGRIYSWLDNHTLRIAIGRNARPIGFSGKDVKWSVVLRPLQPSDLKVGDSK